MDMTNLLQEYGSVFTWVVTQITALLNLITSNALLLVGFGMIAVSAVIARLRALV